MFEIKEHECIYTQEKLLFNIQELLKEIKIENKTFKCTICGKEYENIGKKLACQKKHKKEGKE